MSARPSPMAHVLELHPRKLRPLARTQGEREIHKATVRAHALAAGHPSVAPYDHEVDELGMKARKFAIEALVGFAATSEALAMREAAGIVDALLRRGELVLVDTDPTPAHGTVRL